MHISITDDFDLAKIARSGQCFRVKEFEDGYNITSVIDNDFGLNKHLHIEGK